MPSTVVDKLALAEGDDCVWVVENLPITVATSYDDDTPFVINLIDTLGHKVTCRQDCPKYWLPKEFSQNSREFRKQILAPMIARACQQQGFTSILKGWEPGRSSCIFTCMRAKYYDFKYWRDSHQTEKTNEDSTDDNDTSKPNNAPKGNLVKGTKRPIKEDACKLTCPFRFTVYWSPTKNRWFLPLKQTGCNYHCYHPQEQQQSVAAARKTIKDEETAAIKADLKINNVHNALLPFYKECTAQVKTVEEYKYLREALQNAYNGLTVMARDRDPPGHHGGGGAMMARHPTNPHDNDYQQTPNSKRKKQTTSLPTRKKSRNDGS